MPVASLDDIAAPASSSGRNVASLADIAGPDDKKESYLGGLYASTLGPLVQTVTHPIDTATGLAKAVIGTQDLDEIAKAVKAGNYKDAALRVGKWAQEGPGGRMAHGIVDPVVTDLQQGNYAGAGGRVTGAALTLGAPLLAETAPVKAVGSAIARGAPDIGTGAAKVAAGTIAGNVIPGAGMLTRLLFDYPGARQVISGVGKMFKSPAQDIPVADKVAAAVSTAATEAADPLLDAIAQGQGYPKGFKSVPAQGQNIIRNLAQAMRQSEAAKAAPRAAVGTPAETVATAAPRAEAPATPNYGHLMDSPENQPVPIAPIPPGTVNWQPGPPGTPAPWEPPVGATPDVRNFTPAFGALAEQLRDAMLKNGNITAEHLKPPVPVEPEPISIQEAAQRADRAGKLAALLHQHGITVEDIPDIAPEHWEAMSKSLGINPPSLKTIAETAAQLGQLENEAAQAAAPAPRIGQMDPRTAAALTPQAASALEQQLRQ